MVEKLEELKTEKPASQQHSLQRLTNEASAQLQSQERIVLLQEHVGEINTEFNQKLAARFPDLSRADLEFCGFIRLNMSNKEIAILKNISQDSAKTARYRLRKKMGLQPEEDIYDVLSSL